VRLEVRTEPHVYKKIHEFLINMAFTMACPNFKKGLKMAFGPLTVNSDIVRGMQLKHTWSLTIYGGRFLDVII
jgi:hypothetical protein